MTYLQELVPPDVNQALGLAFNLHQAGNYPAAVEAYIQIGAPREDIEDHTPVAHYVNSEWMRGAAAGLGQQGEGDQIAQGIALAQAAREQWRSISGYPEMEQPGRACNGMLGRLLLQDYIRSKRSNAPTSVTQLSAPRERLLEALSSEGQGPSRQNDINYRWLLGLSRAWYGEQSDARATAWEALHRGWQSEARSDPSSRPELSPLERLKAKARAVVRPAGVLAVTTLLGSGDTTRRIRREGLSNVRFRAAAYLSEALFVGRRRARDLQLAQTPQ